jgi:hypothetical protein
MYEGGSKTCKDAFILALLSMLASLFRGDKCPHSGKIDPVSIADKRLMAGDCT